MDFIKSYSLVKSQNGYDLVLYFDSGTMDSEFACDLCELGSSSLNHNITQCIIEKFPNIEINTVKVMVGTVLISSFIMTPSPSIQMSDLNIAL